MEGRPGRSQHGLFSLDHGGRRMCHVLEGPGPGLTTGERNDTLLQPGGWTGYRKPSDEPILHRAFHHDKGRDVMTGERTTARPVREVGAQAALWVHRAKGEIYRHVVAAAAAGAAVVVTSRDVKELESLCNRVTFSGTDRAVNYRCGASARLRSRANVCD